MRVGQAKLVKLVRLVKWERSWELGLVLRDRAERTVTVTPSTPAPAACHSRNLRRYQNFSKYVEILISESPLPCLFYGIVVPEAQRRAGFWVSRASCANIDPLTPAILSPTLLQPSIILEDVSINLIPHCIPTDWSVQNSIESLGAASRDRNFIFLPSKNRTQHRGRAGSATSSDPLHYRHTHYVSDGSITCGRLDTAALF
jgi:hypothetical protein